MEYKNLNEMQNELLSENKLTDELLSFFKEIDVMNSVGMMSWLTSTCKDAIKKLENGDKITYNDKVLDKEGFLGVLNNTVSDLLMKRILGIA